MPLPASAFHFFDLASVRVDARLPLPQLLASVERQIAAAPVEVAFVFDARGRELLRRVGLPSEIAFSPAETAHMREAYLTHNHPQQGPLSPADILFAHRAQLTQLRAVAGDAVFVLTRPAAGWNEPAATLLFNREARRIVKRFESDNNLPQLRSAFIRLAEKLVKVLHLDFQIEHL